jgi:hypothetical protein
VFQRSTSSVWETRFNSKSNTWTWRVKTQIILSSTRFGPGWLQRPRNYVSQRSWSSRSYSVSSRSETREWVRYVWAQCAASSKQCIPIGCAISYSLRWGWCWASDLRVRLEDFTAFTCVLAVGIRC